MPPLDEIAAQIDDYVAKYMGVLAIHGERPIIKLRNNLGSKWLGRSTWSSKRLWCSIGPEPRDLEAPTPN
jgi:hypothetical protein